jgi:hypothetical protein
VVSNRDFGFDHIIIYLHAAISGGRNAGYARRSQFCSEMAVCAVTCEPVSTCNSLLSGKLTGNIAIFGLLEAISVRKTPVPQPLRGKFPTQINRENITRNRECFAGIREFR